MDMFLLDTNHLITLLRKRDTKRPALLAKLANVPSASPVCVATVTLAELETGCACRSTNRTEAQAEVRTEAQAEVREVLAANNLHIRPFTKHTAAEYGAIKAALMNRYNRAGGKNSAKWPEGWSKPTTGEKLGVDELDVLLISHAVEQNMVLVSTDAMNRAIEALESAGIRVRQDNWLGD